LIRQQQKSQAIVSGFQSSGSFGIKNSSKAFRILSNNIYSRKIEAIIRELSANAVDAHHDAGTKDVPFEIHLPNDWTQEFSIRDYGTGLSHDNVMKLYVTYFESTKENSNDPIGTLGLGSKAPFSYTDTFNVTSYQNGKKRVYSAYISEEDTPSILYAGEYDTDEANGLEISFPVSKKDTQDFYHAAQKILFWFDAPFKVFPEKVKIHNYLDVSSDKVLMTDNTPFRNIILSGDNYWFYESEHKYVGYARPEYKTIEGPHIKQGPIVYPINISILEKTGKLTDKQIMILKKNVIIQVNMGDCDFEPGREELNYDTFTVDNILTHLDRVYYSVTDIIKDKVDNISNGWDKFVFFQDNILAKDTNNPYSIFYNSTNKFFGDNEFEGKFDLFPSIKIYFFSEVIDGKSKNRAVYNNFADRKPTENVKQEVIDLAKRKNSGLSIRHYMSWLDKYSNVKFYTYTESGSIVSRFCEYKVKNHESISATSSVVIMGTPENVEKQIKALGNPPTISLNGKLSKKKSTVATAYTLKVSHGSIHTTFNSSYLKNYCDKEYEEHSEYEGYYFLVSDFTSLDSIDDRHYNHQIQILKRAKPWKEKYKIDIPSKLYIFRRKDQEEVEKNPNLKHISEITDKIIEKVKNNDKYINFLIDQRSLNVLPYTYGGQSLISAQDLTKIENPDTRRFMAIIDEYYDLQRELRGNKNFEIEEMLSGFLDKEIIKSIDEKAEIKRQNIKLTIDVLNKTYPFYHSMSDMDLKIELINALDYYRNAKAKEIAA